VGVAARILTVLELCPFVMSSFESIRLLKLHPLRPSRLSHETVSLSAPVNSREAAKCDLPLGEGARALVGAKDAKIGYPRVTPRLGFA